MVYENNNLSLIRLNLNETVVPENLGNNALGIGGDMSKTISDLHQQINSLNQALY